MIEQSGSICGQMKKGGFFFCRAHCFNKRVAYSFPCFTSRTGIIVWLSGHYKPDKMHKADNHANPECGQRHPLIPVQDHHKLNATIGFGKAGDAAGAPCRTEREQFIDLPEA